MIMNNIKALLLDIDGVLVGSKVGYNTPNPSKPVTYIPFLTTTVRM